MNDTEHRWSVILAAGEGTRLSHITTRNGVHVPKQFWSFYRDRTMLEHAVERGQRFAGASRTLTVVASEHERWWRKTLSQTPTQNIIAQTHNRGTAIGALLALLRIGAQDRRAIVTMLPADHFIDDEEALFKNLERASQHIEAGEASVILLGVSPDRACVDYGWIVPQRPGAPLSPVCEFVEKPEAAHARALLERHALWNSFMIVGRVDALLQLFRRRSDLLTRALSTIEAGNSYRPWVAHTESLPRVDLSQDILAHARDALHVLEVSPMGWSDLGTPDRVHACISTNTGATARHDAAA